jgi:hypothetical protein
MITKGIFLYNSLIINILIKMPNINKWRQSFMIETFTLFLSIKGRINFLQLQRYGFCGEQRYRKQFEKPFDFLSFNKELVLANGSGNYAIAFDPSYISKSGKKTPGLGYFWSGVAAKAKWGLEIAGIAAIDIDNHTAFHLDAVQTLQNKDDNSNLTQIYLKAIMERKSQLLSLSNIIVADAWFSKNTFVTPLIENGFTLVSRFRDDANLKYINNGIKTAGRGRPKKYDGKVDPKNINMDIFKPVETTDGSILHTAIVYSVSLGRKVRVAHLQTETDKDKASFKLFFSTDTEMTGIDLFNYYKSRFQIEFLYRDAKQYTGLNDSQARSVNKLNFQFNVALSSLNLAKVVHWLSIPRNKRKSFSMCNVKTINHNTLIINRILCKFGINPNLNKNKAIVDELINFGTIAA